MSENNEQPEIIKELDDLFKEAAAYRKQFEEDWMENERFYRGKHWRAAIKRPVKNWVRNIVETEVPILTDSRPGTDIVSLEESSEDAAKILSSAIKYTYDNQFMSLKVPEVTRDHLITGTGWLYTDWDPDLEDGQGGCIIKLLDWRHVYMDPAASEINEAHYARIRIPVRVEDLKRKFPKHAGEIKPMKDEDEFMRGYSEYLREDVWHPDNGMFINKRFDAETMTILDEDWKRDYTMEDIPEEETLEEIAKEADQFMSGIIPDIGKFEDHGAHMEAHAELKPIIAAEALQITVEELTEEDFQAVQQDQNIALIFTLIDDHMESHEALKEQNPKGQRPKYANNIRLVMRNGSTILYDGDAPVNNGIFTTLTPFYCYKESKSIYGDGEVQHIKDAQKSYNDMDWAEYQGLRLTSNSGFVIDEESGVKADTLTNEPGLVIRKKQGTEARRLEPGTVSPQLDGRKNRDVEAMETISGVSAQTQGQTPTSVTGFRAIRTVQEQSIGRIRLKSRYMEEYSMVRLGKIVASYIVKFWTTERKLRIYDRGGQLQYVDFSPEAVQELKYDVVVSPGTTTGLDKESIFQMLKEMVQGQLIDGKTFVELADIPHKNQILQKMEEQDEQAALLEQLAIENEELKAQLGIPPEPQGVQ